jgi:hypothetical protein
MGFKDGIEYLWYLATQSLWRRSRSFCSIRKAAQITVSSAVENFRVAGRSKELVAAIARWAAK